MEKIQVAAQFKQLLSRGYSVQDIRNLLTAPKTLVDQIIFEYQGEIRTARQNRRIQRTQAEYAMRLGTGR
ncbi:MAG: hypothetical protein ACPGF7_01855 [Pontibacterium sp.]